MELHSVAIVATPRTYTTVEGWHERLKSIMMGYNAEDVWNEDETGCFYRASPDKSLSEKKKECIGGKSPKKGLPLHSLPMLLVVKKRNQKLKKSRKEYLIMPTLRHG